MKLVRVHAPGRYAIDEVPQPNPGPRDVVVRVGACGICGSDLHYVRQGYTRPGGEPLPLGHEAAGIVETVGEDVRGITPGMRVFINPECHDGTVMGNGGTEGAFAPRVLVREAVANKSLLPLPDSLTLAQAALMEPLAVGLHGVNRGQPTAESQVAVYGCGPIGLGAILWLARRGVRHIVAVDISDARLAFARQMGAHATINPLRENVAERLTELHGTGTAVMGQATVGTNVFYDMAGGKDVINSIVAMAQYHARLVITAVYLEPVPINLTDVLMRELEITTAGGYPSELPDVLAALPSIDPDLLDAYVSHSFDFADFDEAIATAQRPDSAKVMVTFG